MCFDLAGVVLLPADPCYQGEEEGAGGGGQVDLPPHNHDDVDDDDDGQACRWVDDGQAMMTKMLMLMMVY